MCSVKVPIRFEAKPGVKSIVVKFYDGDKQVRYDLINRSLLPVAETVYPFENIKTLSMIYQVHFEDGRIEEYREEIIK